MTDDQFSELTTKLDNIVQGVCLILEALVGEETPPDEPDIQPDMSKRN